MSAINAISLDKLARLIGTPKCPVLLDVRADEEWSVNPRLIPGSVRKPSKDLTAWSSAYAGRQAIVICRTGRDLSPGVAAWLRHAGIAAETLEGGFQAWGDARLPSVPEAKLPPRDAAGRTVWVTRSRPKIDRIACPWLIRRFVDPCAVFLFVPTAEVEAVARQYDGAPFDIEGVFWSHRGDLCTFDTMIGELGLATPPLQHLATIVRAADTARPELAPEAPGLLAASLGLSRIYADDLEQLEAGLGLYDAFYRWCRDASGETHNWPTSKPERAR